MYTTLKLENKQRVATVTLNRPEARNAMSAKLMREMIACAGRVGTMRDVDAVIVRGSGVCFSAGADLKDASRWSNGALPFEQQREIASLGYRMCRAWEQMQPITIAAIEGYAVGGALALSLACDWRVAADDAFVSLPEIALGIPLTWGTLARLTALVGPARAKRLTILCERIGAPEALAMGLIDELAPKGQALERARALARRTLAMPAAAVRMSKESINALATALHHAGGHMAHDQLALAAQSDESRAARDAALQRPG